MRDQSASAPDNTQLPALIARLRDLLKENLSMFLNAGSMVGTTAITSLFGFVYWWAAARGFSTATVGVASASVSTMLLLGEFGMLGFGTVLMGRLSATDEPIGRLVTPSLVVIGAISAVIGAGFLFVMPQLSPEFQVLTASFWPAALFVAGVASTSVGLVMDQAAIGLHRGDIQLTRNTIFAAGKLGLLLLLTFTGAAAIRATTPIFASWVAGTILSVLAAMGFAYWQGYRLISLKPRWSFLREHTRSAILHHVLSMAQQTPGLALPLLATAMLSATATAGYFIAALLATFVRVGSTALATVYYATASQNPDQAARKLRLSLGLAFAGSAVIALIFFFGAPLLLELFGREYVEQAQGILRILILIVFPYTITIHYMSVQRVRNRVPQAVAVMVAGGLIQLTLAGVGAKLGGSTGMSAGLVAGYVVVAAFTAPTVYRAAFVTS